MSGICSYHRSLGSRCSGGPSWSSPQTDLSYWGKARWRSGQRICGCRCCWIDGGTRACGSERSWRNRVTFKLQTVIIQYFLIQLFDLDSPLRRPLQAPCRMHWALHRKWCRSHPRNNGSTSFSLTSDLPHQTFCRPHKAEDDNDSNGRRHILWCLPAARRRPLHTWSATLCRRTVLQWYQLSWLEIAARPAQWGGSLICRFGPVHWGSWRWRENTVKWKPALCAADLLIWPPARAFHQLQLDTGTHYPAESLSWYSAALSKAASTPESFQSFWITSASSAGMVPSSMESDKFCSFCASSCIKKHGLTHNNNN